MMTMDEDVVYIKNGEEKDKTKKPRKLYRLMVKSHTMKAIIAELDPLMESKLFQHHGKEMHLFCRVKWSPELERNPINSPKGIYSGINQC
jgi:hypothetical protein